MVPEMWNKPLWESVWACLDPWDSVRLRTASTRWNVPRKQGPHGELFFFLLKKEPTAISELVECGPCVSAETVKACAWIGLHKMAEEDALRLESDCSLDLGDVWRNVCPNCPEWISSGPTSEAYGGFEFYEHNAENMQTPKCRCMEDDTQCATKRLHTWHSCVSK